MNRSASTLFVLVLFFFIAARAQTLLPNSASARSLSGQFIVIGAQQVSPLDTSPSVAANADYVRLEPALLAISAERIKDSVWQELGIDDSIPWRGQIFLDLHPAKSLDENVTIISTRFDNGWNYRVELPSVLSRTRLTRALTGVVLLEFANRNAGEHSAEIPAWLVDGLSQQALATGSKGFILSSPVKAVNGLPESRIIATQTGVNLLVEVHRVLQNNFALTFEQLSWPTDVQLDGADGGVYRASAQLFISEVLHLKNGSKELRAMLQTLPRYYNWQIAFRQAFQSDFPQPVDLEKWWALQVVSFAALDVGPIWTLDAGLAKLDEILSVPVEYRSASNNLPSHVEISLQNAIRNFEPEQRAAVLQAKVRDLRLAEFQMLPPLASLTEQYRKAIADYLGQSPPPRRAVFGKHSSAVPPRTSAGDTLKILDELDAQRRALESPNQSAVSKP